MEGREEKEPVLSSERNVYRNLENESGESGLSYLARYILYFFSFLFSLIPITWIFCLAVMREYERAVHFRLGKLSGGAKGPGIFYFLPFVDTFTRIDLRTITLDVQAQEMITKDSVTVRVNAVVYLNVFDPIKAVCQVENYKLATSLFSQTTLRSVIGESELDELLSKRDRVNQRLKDIIDAATDPWGVHVSAVEVKDVLLPPNMQRAMATQAEAERERRAKVISAEGELQAANQLARAAEIMSQSSGAMQLRYSQTITNIRLRRTVRLCSRCQLICWEGSEDS
eukprot:TRINITY_DN2268_c0_g1_i1.p1 TRINITY_DN2268_c0_g1~~TRINITY_DN2268_c0_g1_i1.p1  ORF type:complete len:284 (+),score=65.14 TRINITY_DN2268_c0_g1_i1:295-1146(+)